MSKGDRKRSPAHAVVMQYDGETTVHAAGGASDYVTLCGLANDGDRDSGVVVGLPVNPKIDCANCRTLFEIAKRLRASDFSEPK